MRWLFVAQDGWGLGHVSRQLGLARELRRLRPNDEHLILTYSEATHLIAAEGFASIKIPASQPHLPAEQRYLDEESRQWLAAALAHTVLTNFRPQAVVLDTFPIGLHGELAMALRLPCYRFLIAREVSRTLPHWEYQESLSHFHALLAPYGEAEIDLPIPRGLPLHWVGPVLVRTKNDLLPRAEARQRLGLPQDGPVCLVSFGGGGNPHYDRLEQWVLALAAGFPHWHFAFTRPPLLRQAQRPPGPGNVSHFAYFPMAECYAAFDTAISSTGSSAYELAHMGVPSILVPSTSPQQIEDHLQKARRILGQNGGFIVSAMDSEALASAFAAMDTPARLSAMKEDRAKLNFQNGAERAAGILADRVTRPR
ncbi:glycosyltransferase [Pelagibius sp. CAU 1746]|uniref:glycosyltransferase n=1 Tax=Pelagibius sp. CAU 1746 TaxID=3140370 RepID=UPI00325A4E3A